jgi:FHA domain
MSALAHIEIWRGEQLLLSHRVTQWPLTIGRSLDCDLVVSDPHVAAQHLKLHASQDSDGLRVKVLQTVNGAKHQDLQHGAGSEFKVSRSDEPHIGLGPLTLKLRWAGELAPEVLWTGNNTLAKPSAPVLQHSKTSFATPSTPFWSWHRGLGAIAAVLGISLWAGVDSWMGSDRPDEWLKTAFTALLGAFGVLSFWGAGWALVSKLFAGHAVFWPHVRIAALAFLSLVLLLGGLSVVAFATSWDSLVKHDHLVLGVIASVALGWHLRHATVLPTARIAVTVAAFAMTGWGLKTYFDWQIKRDGTTRMYMSRLYPPSMRLASTQTPEAFLKNAQSLKPQLDELLADKSDDGENLDELD